MLAHSASHGLPYVLPSQPQTGTYCSVQKQFGFETAIQFFLIQEKSEMVTRP